MKIDDKKFNALIHSHLEKLEDILRSSEEADKNMIAAYKAKERLVNSIKSFIKQYKRDLLRCVKNEKTKKILHKASKK